MQNIAAKTQPAAGSAYRLDRNSAMPLYHQLFIDLRRRLLDGEWQPGDAFLKDSEIEETYAVSRITVRQAMSQLVDGNFVVRYRGRGSFVGNLPKSGARVNHRTVAAEIESLGRRATAENLRYEQHMVSELTAQQLGIEIGAEVGILKRLHLGDGTPFCLESIMLSVRDYPQVFDRVLEGTETLTESYQRLGIDVVKCDQTVNAVMLSDERRAQLGLRADAPALFVERVGYSSTNQPLDVRRLYYRTDVFSLRQEIIWGGADNRIT
ncbi:GntR family transcriptional regulator [Oceaniglobus trochenteri]|uniref:GntR family transcriptional regulator n=1 Tax=Oceaniglobus trochenteri TaxID=2763260 RepID=UPI001CFFAC5C|nr:GntR family transcriptional regulator [Oceaniglobus trochenteri]